MNKVIINSALVFFAITSYAEPTRRPIAKITFKVTDDAGCVVTGITVGAGTFLRHIPGDNFGTDESTGVTGKTDTNGIVSLSIRSLTGEISYGYKEMPGIYRMELSDRLVFKESALDQWQPWNPTVDLKVKRIVNPIPLYTKTIELQKSKRIPEFGKPVGFDLLKADWVKPYGSGEESDFIFTINVKLGGMTREKFGYQIHDSSFHVGFSNDGDGIQSVYAEPNKGSLLRLPRLAPEQGYETCLTRKSYSHKDGYFNEKRDDQNYFFRVRTKKDEDGNIVSALYGKIHGEFDWDWMGGVRFTYYLNPTPNDRNLEFDGKDNLFKPHWRDTSWPKEP